MKNKFKILSLLVLLFCGAFSVNAESADDVLAKAAGKVQNPKGVDASYTVTSGGKTISGVLKASGKKFYVKAAGMESWYNGKTLHSYNPSSKETTVVSPSSAELSEANPLLYLGSYSTYFNSRFSKNKQNGKYIIDLIAKSKKAPAKKITVFLDKKTLSPQKFIVTSPSGDVATITITKLTLGGNVTSSTFDYPSKRLSDVNIIDLR